MMTANKLRKLSAATVLGVCFAIGATAAGPLTLCGVAQARGPVQRTLHGKVEGKDGSPVKGAVVYLRDTRSSQVKSAISEDDGSYRFVQLAQSTDYEVWAKEADKKSKTKSISSFDSRNDFDITLNID